MMNFDDQDGNIWYNGKLVPWRDSRLHVLTHGLHYASCVFEGERVYNGEVFKLREHTQRLIDSGRELGFKIPYSLEELEKALQNLPVKEERKKEQLQRKFLKAQAWSEERI